MGGAKLSAGQSVIMTGTITLSGSSSVPFPVIIKTRGTSQLRSELTTSKGLRVTVISSGAGAIKQPDGTIKRLAPENVAGYRNQYLPALSSLFEFGFASAPIGNLGPANVDGATADVISIGTSSKPTLGSSSTATQASQILFYIDRATQFVTRMQRLHYSENVSDETQTMEIRFSDYRAIQGVSIPFHQQTYIDGSMLMDLQLSSVDLSASTADSDFFLQ